MILFKNIIPCSFREATSSGVSLNISGQPTQGSIPIQNFAPFLTCHTSPSPTNLKESTMAFQLANEIETLLFSFLIHSSRVSANVFFFI